MTGQVHKEMLDKLLSLEQASALLATTEPMTPVPFTVGSGIRFRAVSGWNHGIKAKDGSDLVGVYAQVHNNEYALTKETVEEAGLAVGLSRAYTLDSPSELLVPALNYWFREGLMSTSRKKKDYQFLISDNTAVAFGKQGIRPFSNLALVEQAAAKTKEIFGVTDVRVDYKISHSLRQTAVRLVVPAIGFTIHESDEKHDDWSMGLAIRNSLLGTSQTTIEGYLFRWICSNGMIDARNRSGVFTRRKDATDAEVNAWARQSVDEVFAELTGAGDRLAELALLGIDGNLSETLRDVFEHYRIPLTLRPKIIKFLEEHDGEITMYVVMNAITQVANESGLEPSAVDSLMRVGGDLPYTANERCGADNPCGRLVHSH